MGRDDYEAEEEVVQVDIDGGDNGGSSSRELEQNFDTVNDLAAQIFYRRKIGDSFLEIADELQIKRDDAVRIYRKFVVELAAETSVRERDQIMALEMSRIDDLGRQYYIAGMNGDIEAAKFALELMKYRGKILRLDQPTPDDLAGQTQFIVVSGTKEEFQAALEHGRRKPEIVSSTVRDDGGEEDE